MTDGRTSIIRSVQTPLGFFTLVVLVSEVILGALATRAAGNDFTLLIAGMLGLLFALVLAVFRMARGESGIPGRMSDSAARKYDVFLSSVLAGFGDDSRLRDEKRVASQIVECLEQDCGFTVYYAGRSVESARDFDGSHIGAKQDLGALRESRYFLMLYPERVTSSVLFEAGYALDHCEMSIYLVSNSDHLPYLMRRLPEAVPHVRTFKFDDVASILRMIRQHRGNLFKVGTDNAS